LVNKVEIPDKATFKIGEVAKLLELEPYVLRYWETEFEQLTPSKTRSGQRVYEAADIEQLVRIRDLLYVEQYTIAGARRQLELGEELADGEAQAELVDAEVVLELESANAALEQELMALRDELSQAQEREQALLLHTEDVRSERDELTAQVQELEQDFVRVTGLFEDKKQELERQRMAEASRVDVDERWEEMTSQLGEDVERLERELNTYRQELIILEQERDTLLAERTQLEARCQEYVSRLHVQHQGKGRLLELLRRELVGLHQVANAN
jgi:DNA-binding transcriptional MerR regulator